MTQSSHEASAVEIQTDPGTPPREPSRGMCGASSRFLHGWAVLRRKLISIPEREVLVKTRGFRVNDRCVAGQLEDAGRAFVFGYNAAAGATSVDGLKAYLESYHQSHRGFAFEGASMGLAVADFMTPFSRLWRVFAQTIGAPHIYMVYVGYGWSLARLPVATLPAVMSLEQPIRWLAMDGFGFHQGYFHWPNYIRDVQPPKKFSGYALRAFDQGLGRSLWFVQGAEPDRVEQAISRFSPERAQDLWAGVGLAATYAGGVSSVTLDRLRVRSGDYFPHLAQGAVFAAEARWRAGNPVAHNEHACRVFCGASLEEAAQIARDDYPADALGESSVEPYEIWRTRIRKRFGANS